MESLIEEKMSLKESISNWGEELEWMASVIEQSIKNYFEEDLESNNWLSPPDSNSIYCNFVKEHKLSLEQRFILGLALVPHIQPDFLDNVFHANLKTSGEFPQIGGARGKNFRGFLPTGETAIFLLSGGEFHRRFEILKLFDEDSFFLKNQVLWLSVSQDNEPITCGRLVVSQEYVELFTRGKISCPRFGTNFPAQKISTEMDWNDLVLNEQTNKQIRELENWIKYGKILSVDWGLAKKMKPGYRVLFHGPPGTGKTLTASLLGKHTGREVFKIDLSMVVSKFIGETEKNLANLFTKAENKDWILFFDEADALFGKRTNVRDAHDKYANQEVSYLLQRTENYSGLVILASNFKNNIDDAFTRRFQSIVYFPMPKYEERLKLWELAFPKEVRLSPEIDFNELAQKYELSGANIINIVQYSCLKTISENLNEIELDIIKEGIKREYAKEDKMV